MIPRVDVLGVGVSALDLETAVEVMGGWIDSRRREYVCVTGVHGVMESQKDSQLMRIHNESGLTTPDGMPLVWCGRFAGSQGIDRVYGPDLMLRLCSASESNGWKHFFYGAGPGVADDLAKALTDRFPELEVIGTHSPPFRELTEQELAETVAMLNDAGADVIWVGLSTPKQEMWMAKLRPVLEAPLLIGVGAAFDIHAGRVPQAPRWMQRSGLEWLFRLVAEPRRLWRRYTRVVPAFLWRILRRPPVLGGPAWSQSEHR